MALLWPDRDLPRQSCGHPGARGESLSRGESGPSGEDPGEWILGVYILTSLPRASGDDSLARLVMGWGC